MFSSLAHFPGDSLKKILCRDGNRSLTGKQKKKDLPKTPKHSEVTLKYRDSQGHCYSVCMCKKSPFLVVFEAVGEFLVHRGVLSLNCHGVSGLQVNIIQQASGRYIHRALKSFARDNFIRSAALSQGACAG